MAKHHQSRPARPAERGRMREAQAGQVIRTFVRVLEAAAGSHPHPAGKPVRGPMVRGPMGGGA